MLKVNKSTRQQDNEFLKDRKTTRLQDYKSNPCLVVSLFRGLKFL